MNEERIVKEGKRTREREKPEFSNALILQPGNFRAVIAEKSVKVFGKQQHHWGVPDSIFSRLPRRYDKHATNLWYRAFLYLFSTATVSNSKRELALIDLIYKATTKNPVS